MLFLGIETSCDDTSAAIVQDGKRVLSSVATNQDAFHAKYGGIVPEIASRQHVALLSAAIEDAAERANVALGAIDGIAVTRGPGLIGSLVGIVVLLGVILTLLRDRQLMRLEYPLVLLALAALIASSAAGLSTRW